LVTEYNEKVKKKGEGKAVKGVDETEHDKTGCIGGRMGVEAIRQKPMSLRCACPYHEVREILPIVENDREDRFALLQKRQILEQIRRLNY
jgi:hypothetical protein